MTLVLALVACAQLALWWAMTAETPLKQVAVVSAKPSST